MKPYIGKIRDEHNFINKFLSINSDGYNRNVLYSLIDYDILENHSLDPKLNFAQFRMNTFSDLINEVWNTIWVGWWGKYGITSILLFSIGARLTHLKFIL